jgi:hypothetical protein
MGGATRSVELCGHQINGSAHICALFDSREEEYRAMLPYLADGLEEGDRVLTVIDAARLDEHLDRIAGAGVDVDAADLAVSTSEDTYLQDGVFDIERMEQFVRQALVDAQQADRCVRTAGWMDWIHREAPGTEHVMEYESRMNYLTRDFDCTFVCVYDITKLSGTMLVDIMTTHPYVMLNGQVRENAHYIPPEQYLQFLDDGGESPGP